MADKGSPTANRLALLGKDAELALEYLQTLGSVLGRQPDLDPRGALHSALMHAAIVIYARSFKKSQGTRGEADVRADLGQLAVSQDSEMMALHMRVIEARDTMIAHSDWDKRRSVVIGRQGPGAGGGAPGEHAELRSHAVLRSTTMEQGWEGIDAAAFSRLASLVREQAERLAFDLERLR